MSNEDGSLGTVDKKTHVSYLEHKMHSCEEVVTSQTVANEGVQG